MQMLTNLKNNFLALFSDERIATNATSLIAKVSIAVLLIGIGGALNLSWTSWVQLYDYALLGAGAYIVGCICFTQLNILRLIVSTIVLYLLLLPVSVIIFTQIYPVSGPHHMYDLNVGIGFLLLWAVLVPLAIRRYERR
jgi:hypothetical protein